MEITDFTCIICYEEDLINTVRKYFKCAHIVCKQCFLKYMKRECPICRQ